MSKMIQVAMTNGNDQFTTDFSISLSTLYSLLHTRKNISKQFRFLTPYFSA